jgi:hypothetical protein
MDDIADREDKRQEYMRLGPDMLSQAIDDIAQENYKSM